MPGYEAERFAECYVTGNAVNRNAHDLGVIPFKVGHLGLISRHLYGSHGCPVERIEDEDDVLLSTIVAELALLVAAVARQREIGRLDAHFQRRGPIGNGGPSGRTSTLKVG